VETKVHHGQHPRRGMTGKKQGQETLFPFLCEYPRWEEVYEYQERGKTVEVHHEYDVPRWAQEMIER